MCYLQVYVVFDFPDETRLKSPANVAGFLSELVKMNDFRLSNEDFESPEAAWNAAVRQGQRSVYVAMDHAGGYSLSFSVITSNWRRLYVTANRGQSEKAENVRTLVSACETFYKTLAPDYGFGFVSMDTNPLPPPGEGDYGIDTLYDFNFLSPRLVSKLGTANLNNAPSFRTVPFEDYGLLLDMSPNPLMDRKKSTAMYQAAAAVLGIPKFQQGC
jgi:hypothetical protein